MSKDFPQQFQEMIKIQIYFSCFLQTFQYTPCYHIPVLWYPPTLPPPRLALCVSVWETRHSDQADIWDQGLIKIWIIPPKSILNSNLKKILFVHCFFYRRQILLIFCTKHGSQAAMLCAKYQKNLPSKMDVMSKWDFALFVLAWDWAVANIWYLWYGWLSSVRPVVTIYHITSNLWYENDQICHSEGK